jgi:hypothetical protein
MNHIDQERLQDFANDSIADLTELENNHIDECAMCWSRLVAMLQLVVLTEAELKILDIIM